MGNEGDLWDDSALINAFDHAISTYKKMHATPNNKSGSAQEPALNESTIQLRIPITTRDAGENDNNSLAPNVPDSVEICDVSNLEQNHLVDQPSLDSTSGQDIKSAHNGYAYALGADDDYNQLLAQYYELEEKRMKILEQIYQYCGWNYQYNGTASGSGVQYYNSQDYSIQTDQVSDPNAVCTCCPCFNQSPVPPCTSVPGCSLGGASVGKPRNDHSGGVDREMSLPCEDGEIRKMAMGAAERALSTIRTTISTDLGVNGKKERNNTEPEQSNGSETDLTAVLNAWYSAGFYTGKYLAEQSIENRRQK